MKLDELLTDLINDIAYKNKRIMEEGKYKFLVSLCPQDISIISLINKYPNISAKKITSILNDPKSTVNSAIKRLDEKKFIVRRVDENDKRYYCLSLTQKGLEAEMEHQNYEKNIISYIKEQWNDSKGLENLLLRRKKYAIL